MTSSDEEKRSSHYMSYQKYVYGEPPSVPSPIRKHFRKQDESSCRLSSSGILDEETLDERWRSKNQFDEDVLDLEDNEAEKVVDDKVTIIGTTNHFDDNEVTPNRPRLRNPSKFMCTPFT
uniref:Uncharacterized protein n=1 Tax=Lactuca sativa TaxID=4236 RepID=A0A9R1XQY0_LACSA|nr:hypothetical protein LSAT_V11C200066440 [Lactuca sativa]